MTKLDYVKEYDVMLREKYELGAGDVWDYYMEKIYPYLIIITDFRLAKQTATEEQIRLVLYVSAPYWRACKETFEEFQLALKSKSSLMALKAQIDVQKGLVNTEYKNPKILEMQSIRYDDEYKPKGQETNIELPNVLKVVIEDATMNDEELEKFTE